MGILMSKVTRCFQFFWQFFTEKPTVLIKKEWTLALIFWYITKMTNNYLFGWARQKALKEIWGFNHL
jgi:hypothetical protein